MNSAVHNYSDNVVGMVEAMRIRAFVLDRSLPLPQWAGAIRRAYELCQTTHRPIVVFVNLME
jgi:hypothetical protein